jgi:hypothetical protein
VFSAIEILRQATSVSAEMMMMPTLARERHLRFTSVSRVA